MTMLTSALSKAFFRLPKSAHTKVSKYILSSFISFRMTVSPIDVFAPLQYYLHFPSLALSPLLGCSWVSLGVEITSWIPVGSMDVMCTA